MIAPLAEPTHRSMRTTAPPTGPLGPVTTPETAEVPPRTGIGGTGWALPGTGRRETNRVSGSWNPSGRRRTCVSIEVLVVDWSGLNERLDAACFEPEQAARSRIPTTATSRQTADRRVRSCG